MRGNNFLHRYADKVPSEKDFILLSKIGLPQIAVKPSGKPVTHIFLLDTEWPDDRDNDQANDQGDYAHRNADFSIIVERESARSENQGVWRSAIGWEFTSAMSSML